MQPMGLHVISSIHCDHYITLYAPTFLLQFSPILTSHPRQYVHHILIYLCTNPLTPEEVDVSVPCNELPSNANECRGQLLIGAWAVGGEVSCLYSTQELYLIH